MGYNGFPVGIKDNDRLNNRDLKYEIIIHAECNAMMFANVSLKGYKLYTYPFMPCPKCSSMIIQAGITTVVSYNKEGGEEGGDSTQITEWPTINNPQ